MYLRRSRIWLLAGMLLAVPCLVHAQSNANKPTAPPMLTAAERQKFDELRAAGFEALYNLDYELARARFREIATLFPAHPAGPQFLATALWTETLNSSRRLSSTLYNSDSFYADTEEKPDPKLVAEFMELVRKAIALSKARLVQDPADVEAIYNLGAAQGMKAVFALAVQRKFIGALGDASDCVDRHREVLKRDPAYSDAELTIGLYDYIFGSLPTPVKLLVGIAGYRGSKKRGLERLERVAANAHWNGDNARSVLIILYKREGRFADALAVSRGLAEKYPRNYLFQLEVADALSELGAQQRTAGNADMALQNERAAFAIFEALIPNEKRGREVKEAIDAKEARKALDLIHTRYGDALLSAGSFEAAAREYVAAASVTSADASVVTMARLSAGEALDLAGKRAEALVQYQTVLSRQNVFDAHERAKKGMKDPFKSRAAVQTASTQGG